MWQYQIWCISQDNKSTTTPSTVLLIDLNWVEDDVVWLSMAIIILADYESSFGNAFNRANEEFKDK